MSQIQISNLTFSYEGSLVEVFQNASFQIDTDWKLGFVGRNGRGKTTLLKLLLGEYEYRGQIKSQVDFFYFPFPIQNQDDLTINVLEEINPTLEQWRIRKEMHLLELDEDILYQVFSTLSKGEQTKILLAALFLKEGGFLLIDEPTNHLDVQGRQQVSAYLNQKKGFILVSHDRKFLDDCVDHILSIQKQSIVVQRGNYSSYHKNKEAKDLFEWKQNEKIKGEIKAMEEAKRKTKTWSDKVEDTKIGTRVAGLRPDRGAIGHKAAKMMKRSKVMENRIDRSLDEKSKLLKEVEEKEDMKLFPQKYTKNTLVSFKNVAIQYNGNTICSDVSFELNQGDRMNLQGRNGSGKSSIIKLILGEDIHFTGEKEIGSGMKISYVNQDTSFLEGSIQDYAIQEGIDETLFITLLRKLDLKREDLNTNIKYYSQGQKKKVLLAKSLCERAHLYIWDEPLNYIDVLSREQIEEVILKYCPTMLFVEHDELFCEKVATKRSVIQ
ncbi:lincosamide and streptogramin A transport system ATP-binding/permease protein [Aequitasia blattaphilus]|uniref:ABC-F type ribosomal protection protein n=1 Tax=Aequitasia blattaphilus TaxID=2949332 RepID=A0ABT1ECH7_9FIRM|nr:ABC-F type ribosomal protection protein [Aequitasia blattaphilus]MCP1103546.1 ABC-F type ribosomal protection protein [Aequitasia blattaphilus]MCR8616186.1 ABC-F type ribosomal protection protein [Aequitasia blattaphilus]